MEKGVIKDTLIRIIKLLIYYAIYQFAFTIIAFIGCVVYAVANGKIGMDVLATGDQSAVMQAMDGYMPWGMALGLFLSASVMLWHLLHFGYFKFGKNPFGRVSAVVMLYNVLLVISSLYALNICVSWMDLPDNLADQMKALAHNPLGVLSIAVVGPILEEVMFRGAIQGYMMRRFSNPWVGIFVAAIVFGLFHMNPVQILYASLIGVILGWMYYRTGSLIPVIIGHILNNSIAAVGMMLGVDDAEMLPDSSAKEAAVFVVLVLLSLLLALLINRSQPSVPRPWHGADEA